MKYKYILLGLLLFGMLTSIATAANPKNTTIDDGNLNDIIDKKEIIKATAKAWDGGLSGPGYIIIGIAGAAAVLAIVIGILGGAAQSASGKFTGNNDSHAKGMSMIAVAVGSAVLIIVSMVVLGMVFAAW